MEASNIIASIALVVSAISAWISYKNHRYSVSLKESESRREFTRVKSEFIVRIRKAQKLFRELEQQLKTLISQIESSPETTRDSLAKKMKKLSSDLDYIKGCQKQASALFEETYDIDQDGFAHHKPQFLKLIEDDEEFAAQALKRIEFYKYKFQLNGKSL